MHLPARAARFAAVLFCLALLGNAANLALTTGAAAAPAVAPRADTPSQYFPQTGHSVEGPILAYYLRTGAAARWGAPLTQAYSDGEFAAQVFERGAIQADPASGVATRRDLVVDLVGGRALEPPTTAGDPAGLYVPATGHTIGHAFLAAWQAPNAAARLGRPITEPQDVEGRTVQYFEFARLTTDPRAPAGVRERLQDNARAPGSPFAPAPAVADPGALFVAATGHSVTGGFLELYRSLGSGDSYGLPLTDEALENGLAVQYFTGGKLSFSADRPAGQMAQVEAVGRDWLQEHAVPPAALLPAPAPPATPSPTAAAPTATPTSAPATSPTPAPPTATPTPLANVPAGWTVVGKGVTTFLGSTAARTQNIVIAARKLDGVVVKPGAIFSFNRSLGDDSEKAGFVKALIIYNGRTIEGVGGGICQVASTFFRNAFNSGFDIVERHPHSYRVSWYEPPVGIDATVFSDEGVDLRWRNNLPAPVLLRTQLNLKVGTLTVTSYSAAQQPFTVSMDGPYTSKLVPHGPALYENDASLPKGQVKQVEHAKDGLDVVVNRVLTDRTTGKVLRRDRFYSHYVPWRDVFKRGTGTGKTNPNGSTVTVQKP